MTKFSMTVTRAMEEALNREREMRKLGTVQETIRAILGEYFRAHGGALVTFKRL